MNNNIAKYIYLLYKLSQKQNCQYLLNYLSFSNCYNLILRLTLAIVVFLTLCLSFVLYSVMNLYSFEQDRSD